MDLGVVALLPREVAYATGASANPAAVASVLSKARRLILLQLPLAALLGCGVFWYLHDPARDDGPALGLIVLAYAVQYPLRIYPATLQGLQDLAFLGWTRTGLWLVQAIVLVVGIRAGLGMWALALGWIAQQGLLPLICWGRLRLAFPDLCAHAGPRPTPQESLQYLSRGLWVTLTRVAQVLLNGTEILLVQHLLGPAAVVIYVCSSKLVTMVAQQTYSLVLTAEPALSELRGSGDADRLVQVSAALRELMLQISGLAACVVLATNEGFVTWWVGAPRYAGQDLTLWLLTVMMVRHFTFTLGHLLYCCGYERALACLGVLDGVATILAGWLLIPILGLAGAPIGSLLGVLSMHLPVCLYLCARDSRLPLLQLLRGHLPWLWRFAVLMLGVGLLSQVYKPSYVPSLLATGLSVCFLYAALMLPALLRSGAGPYVRPRLARFWPWRTSASSTPHNYAARALP
jgi:O-antigen/teichoic acid export membrane protein